MNNKIHISSFLEQSTEYDFNYLFSISPKLDFIYFALPKNACSTILVLLRSLFEDDIQTIKENVHDRQKSSLLTPSDIGDDIFLKLILDPNVFKFTVVRNPYSRILSAYLNKFVNDAIENIEIYQAFLVQLVDQYQINQYMKFPNLSFWEFLTFINKKKPYYMNPHWKPQSFQCNMSLITYNQIYKFEKLNGAIDHLIDTLKTRGYFQKEINKEDFSFISHSTNASKLLSSYYTDECLDLFNQIYIQDLIEFGYPIIKKNVDFKS